MTIDQTGLEKLANQLDSKISLVRKTGRAIQIARHYRWSQIARRGVSLVRTRITGNRRIGATPVPADTGFRKPALLPNVAAIVIESYRNHISHQFGNLRCGSLSLLNHTVETGWPVNWNLDLGNVSHLWRFQLQYHEYLLSFLADNTDSKTEILPRETVEEFLLDWIRQHAPERTRIASDSWHPYCISRRIPVWIWILGNCDIRDEVRDVVVKSIFQQAAYLCDNPELVLRGNHLFENLTALVLAACCMEGKQSDRWLQTASRYLHRELSKQVLPYGEHFELSPMYHCQVLGNILKMICLLDGRDQVLVARLRATAQPMLDFLDCITLPDGEIPLLGDSGFGEAPGPQQIHRLAELAAIEPVGIRSGIHVAGPYWVFDSGQSAKSDWLLFDRGSACSDELPAHGHCDLLNIVACVGGRRWIIDSGNYNYEDSSMRRYCRSSLAHNVVTVENQNQCEIWSSFRMGRRARPINLKNGCVNQFNWASASHDGYDRWGVHRMERLIATSSVNHFWICADLAHGKSRGSLIGYLHLSHDLDVREAPASGAGHRTFILDDTRQQKKLTVFGSEQSSIVDGWQCLAFGVRNRNPVIVYRQAEVPPGPLGWVLYDMNVSGLLVKSGSNRLQIETSLPAITFDWIFC